MSERRKVLNSILILLLPALLVVTGMFIAPFDKQFGYAFMQDNCMRKSKWIYNRLFEDNNKIDIAFVGTSHTIDAINEDIVRHALLSSGVKQEPANLGYCRIGRNMDYAIIKDLVKNKKPEMVVLEVREKENRDGHPDFGYIADGRNVLAPVMFFNDNYFSDLYNGIVVRAEILKGKIIDRNRGGVEDTMQYTRWNDSTVADGAYLNNIKQERSGNWKYSEGFSRW